MFTTICLEQSVHLGSRADPRRRDVNARRSRIERAILPKL
jgi:hypothetical protein